MSTLARATSIRSIRSIELVCLYLVSVAGFLVSTATLSLDTEDGMGMGMLTLAFVGWALFSNVARAAAALGCREQCLDAPFHSVLTILSQVWVKVRVRVGVGVRVRGGSGRGVWGLGS